MPVPKAGRIKVWDAPVRLFHWALMALIGVAWWTGEQHMLEWHRLAGYLIATLLLFRIIWGVVGSGTARFASFIHGPRALLAHWRAGRAGGVVVARPGHNPFGGWSVVTMLFLLVIQVVLGMFAVDIDGMESGPFSWLVEFDTGRLAARCHGVVFNILLAFIALHIAAIAYYQFYRRNNLVGAMITGSKAWSGERPTLRFAPGWLAVAIMLACGGLFWFLIAWWGRA
ncbi:Ni/Fe-hydrogenase 1 b-type cytochrome subunit [Sphingobium sp. CAP-1]|nr:Ni/Fe-hydrogenase 1 b-type cytochrome subunit [Sphingobium sp. CAP-1]